MTWKYDVGDAKRRLCTNHLAYALLFVLPLASFAQTAKKQQPKPLSPDPSKFLSLLEVIDVESFARTLWELAANRNVLAAHPEDKPKTPQEAASDIDKFISAKVGTEPWTPSASADPRHEGRRGLLAEQALFKKHRDSLSTVVGSTLRPLLYSEIPARFALKDGALTLLLTTLDSENVYNTLRLDSRQRAAKEIDAIALPAIERLSTVRAPDVKYFGVIVAYGTRDFSQEDSSKTPEAELVVLVAQADRCRKVSDAELTEEEFVDTADVYLVDGGVRKIKVSLNDAAK